MSEHQRVVHRMIQHLVRPKIRPPETVPPTDARLLADGVRRLHGCSPARRQRQYWDILWFYFLFGRTEQQAGPGGLFKTTLTPSQWMPCIVFTFIGSSYSSAEEDVAKDTINAPVTLAQDAQVSFIQMDDDIPTMMIIVPPLVVTSPQ